MIKRKRALVIAMTAALGFTAAACGDDDESSDSTAAAGATDTTMADTGSTMGDTGTAMADTAATTGDTGDSAPTGSMAPAVEAPAVGLLFDITGRGDRSFNDAAAAGLDQATSDLGAVGTESTPSSDGDRAERLAGLVDAGNDLVIGVGFLWQPALQAAAAETPDQLFALIDAVAIDDPDGDFEGPPLPNVASLVFAEEQGSFLVGAAAALKSQTGTVGFIGGVETDLIKKFEAGFQAGAEAANPDVEVLVQYITQPPDFAGFNDPARGKEIAASMYGDGADVVYSAAGGSGLGALEAASEAGAPGEVWGIGVDSDVYNLVEPALQPYVLTSMLKKVDVAVFDTIEALTAGEFVGGVQTFDLASGGVDYSTTGGFVDDIADQLDDFKQQIIDGEIEVPTAP
ncbi:MAG: BMP family ABC transporter substrate-binding protein [Acidimicrobiia bacterium]|nr:BMP family ABC transporter substrate-binding protein [Acidimicrobiia bacterium]